MTFLILSPTESSPTMIDCSISTADSHVTHARGLEFVQTGSAIVSFGFGAGRETVVATESEFADVSALEAELDSDPSMQQEMREARQWAGSVLHGETRTSLRALRLASGISQGKFAREMNTDQAMVSRWENGKVDMRMKTMQRIARVLNVSLEAVFLAVCASSQIEDCQDA